MVKLEWFPDIFFPGSGFASPLRSATPVFLSRRTVRQLVLDIDSSVSETWWDRECIVYNGQFRRTCHPPAVLLQSIKTGFTGWNRDLARPLGREDSGNPPQLTIKMQPNGNPPFQAPAVLA